MAFLDVTFVISAVLPHESVNEMFFVLSVAISEQGTALNSYVYISTTFPIVFPSQSSRIGSSGVASR